MHTPTVVVSLLLACGGAAAVTFLGRPADALPNPDLAAQKAEVAMLRDQLGKLEARLEQVAAAPARAEPSAERVEVPTLSTAQVATAVEAYLRDRQSSGAATAAAEGAPRDLAEIHAELLGSNFWANSAGWKKAFAEGRMDELIARFEAEAEASPKDIGKQMALANAYMAYLQMDQSKWQLSQKADETFDRVLAIDERHWEARFTKAVSYTFWPEFLGKKKEAISHFETLVAQQESGPVHDHQAQTYLYLGNLLESKDPAKAREMWQRGAARHPTSAELRSRLGQ